MTSKLLCCHFSTVLMGQSSHYRPFDNLQGCEKEKLTGDDRHMSNQAPVRPDPVESMFLSAERKREATFTSN